MEPYCKHLWFAGNTLSVLLWATLMLTLYLPLGSLILVLVTVCATYARSLDVLVGSQHRPASNMTTESEYAA